jgi:hypothetical protein
MGNNRDWIRKRGWFRVLELTQIVAAAGLVACSSSSNGSSDGALANNDGGGGNGCGSATPVALTVKNYLSWCAVTVGTGAPVQTDSQTVCVADGTVALSATPLPGFQLGVIPWHDTAGDTGSGDPGTVSGGASTTTVVVSGAGTKCAWVCCDFADGTIGCPTADQCP